MNRSHLAYSLLLQVTTAVLCLVVLVVSLFHAVSVNLEFTWTSIRLMPSFALLKGLPLYSLPKSPPWVMVGYGPLYPLAYLPASLASTPVSAVWIGTTAAFTFILVPVALISQLVCRSGTLGALSPPFTSFILTLLFAMIALMSPALNYVMSSIHVDAPALGLLLMAAYFMLLGVAEADARARRFCILSGMSAGMSLCCKLNILPSVVALSLFAIWLFPRLNVMFFLASAAASVACSYMLSAYMNGLDSILTSIKVLGSFPWAKVHVSSGGVHFTDEVIYGFLGKVETAVKLTWDYLTSNGLGILFSLFCLGKLAGESGVAAKERPFAWKVILLFLLLAAFLFPASIASLGKHGGDVNSRALFVLPLTLACFFSAFFVGCQSGELVRRVLYVTGIVLPVLAFIPLSNFVSHAKVAEPSLLEQDFNLLKSHPGQYYFPYDPLAHVLAENHFRPSIDPVYCYAVANMSVRKEAFRKALPSGLRYLVLDATYAQWGRSELERLLPEFHHEIVVPGLSRHRVLAREDSDGTTFP